jgi:hypothetical protein
MALPSRLRVLSHLSHERSEAEATVFLAKCKARTDGCAPFFTSDQLPAYVAALIANYSTPEPPPRTRGLGVAAQEHNGVCSQTSHQLNSDSVRI